MVQAVPQDQLAASNPFPVYPVQRLSELRDIRAATVETPEIKIVRDAVMEFAKTFDPANGLPPRHLVMAVKGDFGTGKTHLMLYALSLLQAEIRRDALPMSATHIETSGPAHDEATERTRAMLVVANEASVEDWYGSVLGPALIRSARPREMLRDLMTNTACGVAEENERTRHLAEQFRQSPQEMFEILRSGDAIDVSKIESRFAERLAQLAPDADDDFLRCLASLRWTETAPLAERWLTCVPLNDEEAKKLGVKTVGDRASRARMFIVSMASICRYLNLPFALFIDEFEHLARYDTRNESRRNVTWLKRLVEALSGTYAMVFVSGHWKAWEQQGDFLDRFTGRPALQLVRLDTDDISAIVRVMAPSWVQHFPSDAAGTLADVTSGNIRRVMTVLYDLYSRAGPSWQTVTPKMVTEAAGQRLHRAPEEGFLGIIDQAVRARGGILERDGILAGERFDGIVRVDGAPRLVIRVLHARDESALLAEGEKLADQIKAIRRTSPRVRGLFIAVGAVNSQHVRTLDAARAEVDVVDGEDPEIGPKVSNLVATALTDEVKSEKPRSDAEVEKLREELRQLRLQVLERSTEQIARAQQEFSDGERSMALRDSVSPAVEDVSRQRAELERRDVVAKMIADERRFDPLSALGIIRGPIFFGSLLAGFTFIHFSTELAKFIFSTIISIYAPYAPYPRSAVDFASGANLVELCLVVSGYILIALGILNFFNNCIALLRFRRFRLQVVENLSEFGAPPPLLRRARVLMDQAVAKAGLRRAAGQAELAFELEGINYAGARQR